jgi:hypothetical protein
MNTKLTIREWSLDAIPVTQREAALRTLMIGYAKGELSLCSDCALQLSRKILEDLCELLAWGGRHG